MTKLKSAAKIVLNSICGVTPCRPIDLLIQAK